MIDLGKKQEQLDECMKRLIKRWEEGQITDIFAVVTKPGGICELVISGDISGLAEASSILQAEFTTYYFGTAVGD